MISLPILKLAGRLLVDYRGVGESSVRSFAHPIATVVNRRDQILYSGSCFFVVGRISSWPAGIAESQERLENSHCIASQLRSKTAKAAAEEGINLD